MADIALDRVTKRFGDGQVAVAQFTLDITDGEFVILVGPSGCGKSTTLNMIAGLEDISDGELRIDGTRMNDRAPKDRDIAMVFQNYALYPHMSVRQNMGFALKLAKVDRDTINAKVEHAAEILDLTAHLDRRPATLSGGQRQRVAMGRAIVRDPKAFLMDEPLSNLDAKLRVQMRTQISRLQKRLGTTTVYVTHDQTEAMTLGDRVVVMRGGRIQQVGPPQELYERPTNLFVAGFIGSPAMNFLPATLAEDTLRCALGDIPLPAATRRALQSHRGDRDVIMGVRPEAFEDASLVDDDTRDTGVTYTGTVDVVESMGADVYAYFTLDTATATTSELEELARDSGSADVGATIGQLVTRLAAPTRAREGDQTQVWFDPRHVHLFDAATGTNLTPDATDPVDQPASIAGNGPPHPAHR